MNSSQVVSLPCAEFAGFRKNEFAYTTGWFYFNDVCIVASGVELNLGEVTGILTVIWMIKYLARHN